MRLPASDDTLVLYSFFQWFRDVPGHSILILQCEISSFVVEELDVRFQDYYSWPGMEPPEIELEQFDGSAVGGSQAESSGRLEAGSSLEAPMKRVCFVLQVKPDRIEEYKRRHRTVWPEMLTALRATGWTNYSLFLRPDGLLIGYLETPNFDRARAEIARLEVNKQWQSQMVDFFLQPDGLLPDQSMAALEEIFHV